MSNKKVLCLLTAVLSFSGAAFGQTGEPQVTEPQPVVAEQPLAEQPIAEQAPAATYGQRSHLVNEKHDGADISSWSGISMASKVHFETTLELVHQQGDI